MLSISLKFSNNLFAENEEISKNNFQLFFFNIPIKDDKSISFGMKPLYRSDVNIMDDCGQTALDIAVSSNKLKIANAIVKIGGLYKSTLNIS